MPTTAAHALASLPPITQAVEDIVHVQGVSVDTVARRLGIGVDGVRTHLEAARQARAALVAARAAAPEGRLTKGQKTRQAVIDLTLDGVDAGKVAERIGVTRNTVSKILHYARKGGEDIPHLNICARNREIVRLARAGADARRIAVLTGATLQRVSAAVCGGRRRGELPDGFRLPLRFAPERA